MQIRLPDHILIGSDCGIVFDSSNTILHNEVFFEVKLQNGIITPEITARDTPLCYVRMTWNLNEKEQRKEKVSVLGDAWERGYGDLAWRNIDPACCMPWYFFVSNGSDSIADNRERYTECFGVRVRPSAFCYWTYNGTSISIYLDIRNGGRGVILNGRTLYIAEIMFSEYRDCSAFHSCQSFCKNLCADPILPSEPVYGFNNWYYTYGNTSAADVLEDTKRLALLCNENKHKPYMVIDDGWQINSCDGPWSAGNSRFNDLKQLACDIKNAGVIPGIWIRPLSQINQSVYMIPEKWRLDRDKCFLDPSNPEVLDYIEQVITLITSWGYRLIKYDYTTYDIFGQWGMEIEATPGQQGWGFTDRSKTSAEIVVNLYKRIRKAAGKSLLIGCNTISHMCAGLVEINRTGDDVSGKEWERTAKMGVNTLAFRLMQNNSFYIADADCVGLTNNIPYKLNAEWMYLLSVSGSPLFVSWDYKNTMEMSDAVKIALSKNSLQQDKLEPVDWMESLRPSVWRLNGEIIKLNWKDDEIL